MPYIIDGHNLIPNVPGLDISKIDDEIELIKILQRFCRRTRKMVEVYFDNAPPGKASKQNFGMVTAYFIRSTRTADKAIADRLKKLGRGARNWTVVSSDREVVIASRETGARVISAPDFVRSYLIEGASSDAHIKIEGDLPLNPKEIDEWLKIFGEAEE